MKQSGGEFGGQASAHRAAARRCRRLPVFQSNPQRTHWQPRAGTCANGTPARAGKPEQQRVNPGEKKRREGGERERPTCVSPLSPVTSTLTSLCFFTLNRPFIIVSENTAPLSNRRQTAANAPNVRPKRRYRRNAQSPKILCWCRRVRVRAPAAMISSTRKKKTAAMFPHLASIGFGGPKVELEEDAEDDEVRRRRRRRRRRSAGAENAERQHLLG